MNKQKLIRLLQTIVKNQEIIKEALNNHEHDKKGRSYAYGDVVKETEHNYKYISETDVISAFIKGENDERSDE